MNKFKKVYLSRLSNGGFETFMKLVYGNAVADPTVSVKCKEVLARFNTVMGILDDVLVRSQKAPQSDEINLLNSRQLSVFRLFRVNAKRLREFRDPAISEAAGRLWQLTVDYKVTINTKLYRSVSMVHNLLQELEGAYAADVELLGLSLLVSTLKAHNTRLYQLVDERAIEESKRVDGEVAAARKDVTDAYTALLEQVNALVYAEGSTNYNAFIDYVNYNVINYNRYELRQPTKGTQATPDKPEGPQGPTVGGGEDGGSGKPDEDTKPGGGQLKPDPDAPEQNQPGTGDDNNRPGADNGNTTEGGTTNPGGGNTEGGGQDDDEGEYIPPENDGGFGKQACANQQ